MTDPRTIPADLARWHWLSNAARVYRLTNGDYTTKAYGRPGQACDEARGYLRRAGIAQTSFLDNHEAEREVGG
jgi:hypothetical protein